MNNTEEDKEMMPSVDPTALEIARDKTVEYTESLRELFKTYSTTLPSASKDGTRDEKRDFKPFSYQKRIFVSILRYSPLFLVFTFTLSFFWDFNGLSATIFSETYQFEGLLRIMSVSGLIGFTTNWLAIKMLFKPQKKRPLLGHGLIPAQKERIAYRLATAISRDLINPDIIKEKIHKSNIISHYREISSAYIKNIIDDPGFRRQLKKLITSYVDELLADPTIRASLATAILNQIEEAIESKSIDRLAFRTYTFLKGQEAQQIVEEFLQHLPDTIENGLDNIDELLDELPEQLKKRSSDIEDIVTKLLYKLINKLDVHELVEQNIRQLDEQRLENLITGSTNEQLHYIQYLGAILGTVGGFVIWSPLISLTVLAAIITAVLLMDTLLIRYARKK